MKSPYFFPLFEPLSRTRTERIEAGSAQEKLLMALDLHGLREAALTDECWCHGALMQGWMVDGKWMESGWKVDGKWMESVFFDKKAFEFPVSSYKLYML
jgi:hypothetical protein